MRARRLSAATLSAGTVDAVVIAACSPRVKSRGFSFDPRMVLERVNLREQVAWCHEAKHEDTQVLAEDYLRMGMVKAAKMEPLEPLPEETISRTVLVVGGGITGISAALEAAAAGYEVVLVEKQPQLGGFMKGLKKTFPTRAPYTEASADGLTSKLEAVLSNPRIKVFCSTRIVKTEGQPGMFDVTLEGAVGNVGPARGRDRHGHRLEALRCRQAGVRSATDCRT